MKNHEIIESLNRFANTAENSPYRGLRGEIAQFRETFAALKKTLQIYIVKKQNQELPLIISLQGGTGTGKSTIFNALIGQEISLTGLERPKTQGPLVYCHKEYISIFDEGILLSDYKRKIVASETESKRRQGNPETIEIIIHNNNSLKGVFIFDTPDVDSVSRSNRKMAQDIYIVSDAVFFVTSQEKYGDRIPFQMFHQALEEGKNMFIVMNKIESIETFEELKERINKKAHSPLKASQFFSLPWINTSFPAEKLKEVKGFRKLKNSFFETSSIDSLKQYRLKEIRGLEKRLHDQSRSIITLFSAEREIVDKLIDQLEIVYTDVEKSLIQEASKPLDDTTKEHIQAEVRQIFRRYDLLRKPRNFIGRIVKAPLVLFGMKLRSPEEKRRRDLAKMHRGIDLVPLHTALNSYNRKIHKKITITGVVPLQKRLLEKKLIMDTKEIEEAFFAEQEKLDAWLEDQFFRMTEGIPKHKEWGIYSTTILWGLFLISLESVIGGGLNMFEAILDSVVMPFISKGTVEIFAYQELKKLGEELDRRYKQQLKKVLRMQHNRYNQLLETMVISGKDLETLTVLAKTI